MNQKNENIKNHFIDIRLNDIDKNSLNKELFYIEANENASKYIQTLINKNIKNQKNVNHSSLLYVLGITDNKPEREMEIKKISLPDVDIDTNERLPLIEFWENNYGVDKVVQIKTYTYLKEKGSIFAALKYAYPEKKKAYLDNLNKKFFGKEIEEMLENGKKDKSLSSLYKEIPNFNNIVMDLYKRPRTSSQHPAGVILSDISLLTKTNLINENDFWHSASPFDILEKNGMTKFDFLPLTTLNQIDICQKLIGDNINWHNIDFNNKMVLDSFLNAKTNYIFQFGSDLFKNYLKELKNISSLEELAIVCAILRRGPMQVKLHEKYLINKLDDSYKNKDIFYKIKDMDKILKETHGVLVYQEQIMEILSDIAEIDKPTTVKIISILKKKDMVALSKYEELFIENVHMKYKLDKETVKKIWKDLASFGEYGFPKSHAIAYTKIAYASMYYQTNFSKEWVQSLLETQSDYLKIYQYYQDDVDFKIIDDLHESRITDNNIEIPIKYLDLLFEKKDNILEFVKENIESINLENLFYHSFFNFFNNLKKKYILTFEKNEDYQKKLFIKKLKESKDNFDTYSLDGKSFFIFDEKMNVGEKILEETIFLKYLFTKILLIKSKIEKNKIDNLVLQEINELSKEKYGLMKKVSTVSLDLIDWSPILRNKDFKTDKENIQIKINAYVSKIEIKNGKKGKFLKVDLCTEKDVLSVNIFDEEEFKNFKKGSLVNVNLKSVKWNDIIFWNYEK